MKTSKLPSPARSQGANITPERHLTRSTRSVCSPARSNVSGRLTSIIEDNRDSFAYSPLTNRKSVLNDNTNIEEPRRASWWKKLNENSRDVIEVMNAHEEIDANNVIEEYVDILSQEKQNHTLDLPDSSDNESINSIVIPQRKLFNQKDVQRKKFKEICGQRETLAKINKTNNELHDNSVKVTTKNLFGHGTKRSRPVFPEALLNISLNKTAANQTKEIVATEVKGQVKSLFGNRPGVKRKNMFVDFIVSESEDEIPDIEPKIFAFPKKPKSFRRPSSSSRASSITTDVEMDDWNMLPSSTMVDHQLESNENEEIRLYYEEEAGNNDENDEPTLTEKNNELIVAIKSEANQKESSMQVFEDIVDRSTRSMNKSNNKNTLNKSSEQKEKNKSKSNQEVLSDGKFDEIQEEIGTESGNTEEVENHAQSNNTRSSNISKDKDHNKTNKSKSRIEDDQTEMNKSKHKLQKDSQEDTEKLDKNDQSVKQKSMAIDKQKVVEETQEEIDESISLPDEKATNIETKQKNDKSEIPNTSQRNQSIVPAHEEHKLNNDLGENEISKDEQDTDADKLQDVEMEEVNVSHVDEEQNESEQNNKSEVEENVSEEQEEENDSEQEEQIDSEQEIEHESEQEVEHESEQEEEIESEQEVENESEQEVENDSEQDIENDSEQEEEQEQNEQEDQNVSEQEVQNESTEVEASEQDSSLAIAEQSDEEDVESDQEVANQTKEETETNDIDVQNQSDLIEDEESHTNNENLQSDTDNQDKNESIINLTHDTTGRKRNKVINESPEAVLQHTVDPGETFMNQGRNTSIRKTKSIIKNLDIKPSLAPVRESIDFSDGTRNSSAEGSGWDSHRTTRKTLRQTLGKDFSPRKSLRALVMEKSAKRFTTASVLNDDITKLPQANSTEFFDAGYEDTAENIESEEPVHEVSKRTRQATLEMYLQSIKRKNIQNRLQMEEEVMNSIKNIDEAPTYFKKPMKPGFALHKAKSHKKQSKTKVVKSTIIPLEDLPDNLLQDMKYKPPKRYKPGNAAWITKRLYNFLESKLEPKYDFKARLRSERLVENIYNFTKDTRRLPVASQHAIDVLKREMATLRVVQTHFEFYNFFHEYMPREIRVKVVPDVLNKLPLPKNGVFTDIL